MAFSSHEAYFEQAPAGVRPLLASIQSKVESLLPDHRERLFPPTETLSMFMAQALSADRSCQKAVNEAAVKRLAGGFCCHIRSHGFGFLV